MGTYDASQFKAIFENEFTYLNGFLRNTRRYGNRTALTCPLRNRQWTYVDPDRECNRLANALAADGVGKNAIVAYQLMNCAEFAFL
jgi:non-ribosomal peptide synthetase component E (peptide arylation enzyme)